jgi:hypothetical protein
MNIKFRLIDEKGLPQIHIWLNTCFVVEWFGKMPSTLEDVASKYSKYITGEKPTKPYIIIIDGVDIGYIQTYLINDYPDYNEYVRTDEHSLG